MHIGTEKTGTKAIQDYLKRNRSSLMDQGVFYPNSIETNQLSQWEFVAAVQRKPWEQDIGRALEIVDAESQSAFRGKLSDTLDAEFQGNKNANILLISSEHFQSRLPTEKNVSDLKQFLSRWVDEFSVIVYFRRQDKFALSLLSTQIKSSTFIKPKELIKVMNSTPRYYDYLGLYKLWGSVFGETAISARLFDRKYWFQHDIVSDFCATLGLSIPAQPSPILNPSLNRKGFHFLRTINKLYPTVPGNTSDEIRQSLFERIAALYPGKYYPITREQAQKFYGSYRKDNERLRTAAFPRLSAPLFEEDFSEYPEQVDQSVPKYEEAVEIAVELWRSNYQGETLGSSLKRRLRSILNRSK